MTDRQYQSLAEFRFALRVFLRFSEEAAREVGLTPAQHQLLLAIRGWPPGLDEPSIGALAERLQSTPQSTLELARRAEEADLVTVNAARQDRRRQVVTLTERANVRLDALSAAHRDELRRFRRTMDAILDELD